MNPENSPTTIAAESAFDLSSLPRVPLSRYYAAMLQEAMTHCGGDIAWKNRKRAELHDLLALTQISNRLLIHGVDMREELRVDLLLRSKVPLMLEPNGQLKIVEGARLGITYRQEATLQPQPGYSFVQILSPRGVWLPSVSCPPAPVQVLCLGSLPIGVPLVELCLLTYGALTLATVNMNVVDSAGLLNPAAADWWQRNAHLIPISTEPFIQPTSNK